MQNSELAAIFALLAAATWGLSDFFGAKASKTVGPVLSMVVLAAIELPIYVAFYLLSKHHWVGNDIAILYAMGSGLCFTLAGTIFMFGLKAGPVSLVSPIASTYPLMTTLLALLAFGAHMTTVEYAGIILILAGVTTASGLFGQGKNRQRISTGIKLAIITSVVWGFAFATLAQAINRIGWLNASLLEIVFVAVFMPILAVFIKRGEIINTATLKKASLNKFILLNTLVGLVGFVSLSYAISKSAASGGAVPTAVSSSYPVITMVLALQHFKEKVRPVALVGALIGIAGVALLSFS